MRVKETACVKRTLSLDVLLLQCFLYFESPGMPIAMHSYMLL